jgi:hypothetical protein
VSKQDYLRQRQHLNPAVFRALNRAYLRQFYPGEEAEAWRRLRYIHFFFLLLFVLLCETTCAGGYVLTGTITDFSFSKQGLTPAYQKSVRYQAASWGLYNWFPKKKRFPKTSEEIVVYGKAQRTIQGHEVAGFLLGISANFFVPQYERCI